MTQFQPGHSGNPDGRRPGTLNKRTQLARLLEPHAKELIDILVGQAKAGDPNALRLCIERLIPKPKSEGPSITLPKIDISQPDSLEQIRRALLIALAQEEEVGIDSLKVILELYSLSKDAMTNEEEDQAMQDKFNEIVAKIRAAEI